ncbi:glucan endo-1,3-beta-glucosidase, acidic-like [Salvia miltiorrhiza]|uniref:glucan endo-1,3-beta-glucosidase, acidic-like n=1 Tax=Salvia miltiorrhiza TaxID=226208 RepID=UPI0025AB900F|nr:glucan endo-1,3-beta-glucosidase, acidic-like [Salvia miltiorrhiza]
MATTPNHFFLYAMLILIFIFASPDFTAAQIGVCYGTNGQGLPPPPDVVALFKQYNIKRMRIYDPDPAILQALRGSDIELTLGILNMNLQEIAASIDTANSWVQNNVRNYGDVRFRNIIVGNEVNPNNPGTSQYADLLLPAMRNIRDALNAAGLDQVKVTTAIETEVLDPTPSKNFPPSQGEFRPELKPFLDPIVAFLVDTGAPLFANIYPYFAYVNNKQIDFNYAFLQPNSGIMADGVYYDNLYYALVDTMNAALEKSTATMFSTEQNGPKKPPPQVGGGETGVPTEGQPGRASIEGEGDATASIENARIYNNNLVRVVKNGTPRRPNSPIETYIFAMFDENQKPGDDIERHFGLFSSDGQPKYTVDFN